MRAGKTLVQQRFDGLNQGDNVIPMVASQSLVKGVYFVSVIYLNEDQRQVLKVIKR